MLPHKKYLALLKDEKRILACKRRGVVDLALKLPATVAKYALSRKIHKCPFLMYTLKFSCCYFLTKA